MPRGYAPERSGDPEVWTLEGGWDAVAPPPYLPHMSTLPRWLQPPKDGHRIRALLVTIFLLLLSMPFASERLIGLHIVVIVFHVMLVSALYAVATTRRRRVLGVGLILASIGFGLLGWQIASDGLAILFLFYCCQQMLGYVLARGPVTTDKLLASLCVYMLMGMVWAELYTTLEQQVPGAFQNLSEDEPRAEAMPIMIELGYFSFVTQTTLGYGDIVPASPFARTLSVIHAVTAHLYLTVLVARLVALHITAEDQVVEDPPEF